MAMSTVPSCAALGRPPARSSRSCSARAAIAAVAADADPTLPPRSAAELLVDLQTASVDALSGTVVQTADLGLPELPGAGRRPAAAPSFTVLVTGTHTLRVWYAGPDQQRVALLGTLGETDVIRNGTDVWTWYSRGNTATHYQLPGPGTAARRSAPTASRACRGR